MQAEATPVHRLGNTLLRTPQTFENYQKNSKCNDEECFICGSPATGLLKAEFWRTIPNDFPYDAVASRHVMLAPTRHISNEGELSFEEFEELENIKSMFNAEGEFDAIIENLARGRTFMPHYHLHLIQWKRA